MQSKKEELHEKIIENAQETVGELLKGNGLLSTYRIIDLLLAILLTKGTINETSLTAMVKLLEMRGTEYNKKDWG